MQQSVKDFCKCFGLTEFGLSSMLRTNELCSIFWTLVNTLDILDFSQSFGLTQFDQTSVNISNFCPNFRLMDIGQWSLLWNLVNTLDFFSMFRTNILWSGFGQYFKLFSMLRTNGLWSILRTILQTRNRRCSYKGLKSKCHFQGLQWEPLLFYFFLFNYQYILHFFI